MWITDEILSRVDIVDIVSDYVNLKRSWRNFMWLCPFHNEKTPSFVVSPDKQIFKCFWCWKWWNAITFIKEIENVDFPDAIKILAEKAWVNLNEFKTHFSKNDKSIQQKEDILEVNKAALNFFHKQIFENDSAFSYLTEQRQLDKNLIIKYKLGYAPKESWALIKYLTDKWFSNEIILKAGLAKNTSSWSIYSFFTNRIIFPIFNSLWEIVAFSWRVFNWETNTGKYINTPETSLYHKSKLLYNYNNAKKTKSDFLIVCEWYMDVIWLDKLWYDNAVATCWTALTEYHIKLIKRVSPNVVFAFDADNAGLQASLRWLKIALPENIYPKIYHIQWWKDFDEIANKEWKIENIFENSQDWIEFFINLYLWNFNSLSPIQKQEKLETIFEIIRQIWNYSIFWSYLEKVASVINQDVNILYQQLKSKKKFIKKEVQTTQNDDNNYLIPALFYDEFYKNFNISLDSIIEKIVQIIDFLPDENILKKVLIWNINSEDKEKILEKQLWWEETLWTWQQEKIETKVKNETKIYIINLLTSIIKKPSLANEDKLSIMKILNKLRKNY